MEPKDKYAEIREKNLKRRAKEREKRRKEMEKKRIQGYNRYLKKKHKEMEEREKKKQREKERIKAKKEKEREKLKHKRKPGRPKKRGPKKKRKYTPKREQIRKPRPTIDYKVVFCQNGRQNGYFNAYSKSEDAYADIEKIMKEDESVKFPRDTISGGKMAIEEILLLEKNRYGDKENPLLRNEYGKLVEQITDNPKWVILDKFPHKVEETFWVYGYDPKRERKTFPWIYENIILKKLNEIGGIIRIILYLNKIIIKYDNQTMDIIFCKTMQNAVKFYNILLNEINVEKIKNAFFLGSYSDISDKRRALERELMSMTGWSKEQIQKRKTKK